MSINVSLMDCNIRQVLAARLERYQALLEKAYDTLDGLLGDELSSFELDTSEGRQRIVQKRVASVSKEINRLEAEIEYLCNRLNGKGLVSIRLRRKP